MARAMPDEKPAAAAGLSQSWVAKNLVPPLLVFGGILIGLVVSSPSERYNLAGDYGGRGDNDIDSLGNRSLAPAVGSPAAGDSLQVLIIRHGESTNNQIQSFIGSNAELAAAGPAAREQRWLQRRLDDPPLSEKGRSEAELLSDFYAPILAAVARWATAVLPLPCGLLCFTARPLAASVRLSPDPPHTQRRGHAVATTARS